jgi:hypothetical protein
VVATWKTVRVFISSTFRDMQAERDHLVKVVFPALREKLEKYRIHLIDIDLRWGVTKEQADNDEALDLCLKQIDECRPFFVGILGERYGWMPTSIPSFDNPEYGWSQGMTGKSITELEILHGVLNNPQMHDHSFFFFRDPAFIRDVPEKKQAEMQAENEDSAQKLRELKEAIRQAHLPAPPVENYPCRYKGLQVNWRLARFALERTEPESLRALESVAADGMVSPAECETLSTHLRDIVEQQGVVYLDGLDEFGRAVHDRLWNGIKAKFALSDEPPAPAEGVQDELAVEMDFHQRFMESRVRVYIGRESVQRELLEYAEGDETVPCLVTGPSGSGKSAALARFATQYTESHADVLVLPHFVGASPASTNLRQVLRRLCLALQRGFQFTETRQGEGQTAEDVPAEVKQTVNELIPQFRAFVSQVPAGSRVLLVIDALNQLDESDNAQAMYWLPREWPPHVKMIASCIAGSGRPEQVLEVFEHRPHRRVEIGALTGNERLEIVREVPSISAKTLDPEQVGLGRAQQ